MFYTGSTNVFMSLKKIHQGTTVQQTFKFNSQIANKEQLKQAVTNLVQPFLMDLNPCSKCFLSTINKSVWDLCVHNQLM